MVRTKDPFWKKKKDTEGIIWKQNAYKGERCFLIGTGSSLLFERDLARTEPEFTMTCNGLFKWDGMPFQPRVHTMIDHPAFPLWQDDIESLDTFRVAGLRQGWPTDTPKWQRVLQRRDKALADGNWGGYDEEFTWCAGRANVMWTLLAQLAYWWGFSPVYVLGMDGGADHAPLIHCYEVQDHLLGKLDRTPSAVTGRTELSTRRAIPVVRRIYEENGREIINLNPNSFTKGLPVSTLADVL